MEKLCIWYVLFAKYLDIARRKLNLKLERLGVKNTSTLELIQNLQFKDEINIIPTNRSSEVLKKIKRF